MPTSSSDDDLRDRSRALLQRSLSLAVARYLHDHPDAPPAAQGWLEGDDRSLVEGAVEDISGQATARLGELDALQQAFAGAGPELREERRVDLAHARLNLQSARSGSFGTAAGMLRDFLVDAGESPDDFSIH